MKRISKPPNASYQPKTIGPDEDVLTISFWSRMLIAVIVVLAMAGSVAAPLLYWRAQQAEKRVKDIEKDVEQYVWDHYGDHLEFEP